ncbi:MAG: PLP-dependent aminotransferase family protein [Rhodospirillaceae bacterium]|nr:PLP-dependent aminotransferase family protein [Rhodospirillaceae bacterium]
MLSINLDPDGPLPLVEQIVAAIRQQVDERRLRPGARLPSIRGFARSHHVSRFTVVEAYDRLVALGYLQSRRGSGFFAAPRQPDDAVPPAPGHEHNDELVWLIRRLLDARPGTILAGGPWLPDSWLDEAGIRRNLRAVARQTGPHLLEYGDPYGYPPLRELLALSLGELGINAGPHQIVLTHGASQGLEFVIRHLLRPGDAALVDDPGYYNLFGNLRLHGVRLVGVERRPDGPDLAALEQAAAEHRPRVYFTQSAMHNPTGSGIGPHAAFRILGIAERHGFRIVEDDIFCDLQPRPTPRLATLDQLERVIYVRSFSKTLSGSLRVGFLVADAATADALADVKMLSAITSSAFLERLVYAMLTEGRYRKFVSRLRERVAEARARAVRAVERLGMEVFVEPDCGMFLWARFPGIADSLPLAQRALEEGIMLAPGTVFRPHLDRSPWLRFNVATCSEPRVLAWLERVGAGSAAGAALVRAS